MVKISLLTTMGAALIAVSQASFLQSSILQDKDSKTELFDQQHV
jgi:hypothetical protein